MNKICAFCGGDEDLRRLNGLVYIWYQNCGLELWVSKSVAWFVVGTLGIYGQEDTHMIGNSVNIGFALHKKSGKKWDL
jgi:hypothetical protein